MIVGIGSDLCNIERIRRVLDRFGARFEERVFTPAEIARARGRVRIAETYAKRFAAKEAMAKALGTGVPRAGVHWKHMGVINLSSGQPGFELTGGAAIRLGRMIPQGYRAAVHLTLTDDHPWAQAQVIIEALPVTEQL